MAYDRDLVVRCVQRHYDLIVRFAYLDPAAIETPPPSGWTDEQLAVDILRLLGRDEKVIDLLRHLPYINVRYFDRYEVMVDTIPINYLRCGDRFKDLTVDSCQGKTASELCLFPDAAEWPPSLISLTEGRDATWWIIDTDEGVIYPCGFSLVNSEAPDDQPWKQSAFPRQYQEYFDKVYNDFESLRRTPMPCCDHRSYNSILYGADDEGLMMQQLYIDNGWPDNFQRDAYLEAVRDDHPFDRA